MLEEEIVLKENPVDLLKLLFKDGVVDEFHEKYYKINYFGEKNQKYLESLIKNYPIDDSSIFENVQQHLTKQTDERNYIIYIKYKNIYIGGLSIFDFESREGFGLNKYINNKEQSFYIGQWEDNKKNGIGFLKIDNNHLYFGKFKDNQLNEDGLYFNKGNGNYFYGIFNNGKFERGLFNNLKKDVYYIGKFINGKKNDDFSIYVNYNKNMIFIGKIINDIFTNGYIITLKKEETNNNIIMEVKNIVYKNKDTYSYKKNKNLEEFIYTIPKIVNKINNTLENAKRSLSDLENIYDDNIYNNRIGRYNSTENSFSFEKEITELYIQYSTFLSGIYQKININYLKTKIPL